MEYFEQNGIIYRNKNDKNSLFMACLMFVLFMILVLIIGVLQFYIGRPEIPQEGEEYVELREIR
jgi:O-antigen/teichoic acid export membrane protein